MLRPTILLVACAAATALRFPTTPTSRAAPAHTEPQAFAVAAALAGMLLTQPLPPAFALAIDTGSTVQLAKAAKPADPIEQATAATKKAAADAQKATATATKSATKAATEASKATTKAAADASKATGKAAADASKAAAKAAKGASKATAGATKAASKAAADAQAASSKLAKDLNKQIGAIADPYERDALACKVASPQTDELKKACASITKKVEGKKAKEAKAGAKVAPKPMVKAAKK